MGKINIEPYSQEGMARHLVVRIGDIQFETPNVVTYGIDEGISFETFGFPTPVQGGSTINFPLVDYIPYGTWSKCKGGLCVVHGKVEDDLREADLVLYPFGKDIIKGSKRLLETITHIRNKMRDDAVFYLSGPVPSSLFPILAYLGVDLVDNFHFIVQKNFKRKSMKLVSEAIKIRKYIDEGRLREYIEIKARFSQLGASTLKTAERRYHEYLERGYPIIRRGRKLMTVFEEALWRPDVRRFILRVGERYRPPKTPRILLLIPCSAKKPYSTSKTHKIISQYLKKVKKRNLIHEVIVTSPLGAVPRELERVYPAQQYDVPVTGTWSEEEIRIIIESIKSILKRGNYEAVVAHVPHDYWFLDEVGAIFTSKDNILDDRSLKNLVSTLNDLGEGLEPISIKKRLEEEAIGILSYQFGESYIESLGKLMVYGKNIFKSRIFSEGIQIGTYDGNRGYFSLTLEGAKHLQDLGIYWVEIDDFVPTGTVFCAGVKDADGVIRAGDEVAIIHENEIRAVGVAHLPGKIMKESSRGRAVKVRHHV